MNKKILRDLRRVANDLPQSIVEFTEKEMRSGSELIQEGVSEVQGEPVNLKGRYMFSQIKIRAYNHYRRLKRLYKLHGQDALIVHMEQFKTHHNNMVAKYPKYFKKAEA